MPDLIDLKEDPVLMEKLESKKNIASFVFFTSKVHKWSQFLKIQTNLGTQAYFNVKHSFFFLLKYFPIFTL